MDEIQRIENDDNIFVIGDIHGCLDEFRTLLDILPLKQACSIVLIGDYIDRGPHSSQVVDTILELANVHRVYPLLGNHEACLLEFLDNPSARKTAQFIYNGGGATLQSYVEIGEDATMLQRHEQFIRSMQVIYESDRYVFVHAGLPEVPLHDLSVSFSRKILLWKRREFLNSAYKWDKVVVHGHTPCRSVYFDDRRINVDTGCVFNNMLSAIHLPSNKVYSVQKKRMNPRLYLKDSVGSKRKAVRFDGEFDVLVQREGEAVEYRSVNYNEFGLLIEPKQQFDKRILDPGDDIEGRIITEDQNNFLFRGKVVRFEQAAEGYRYGVMFHEPPESEDDLETSMGE